MIASPAADRSIHESAAPAAATTPEARLERAIATFFRREAREESPDGEWQDGIWQPTPSERRPCCGEIAPTPGNKQALEAHCRTILHVAARFDVPATDLKRAVRAARSRVTPSGEERTSSEQKPQAEVFFEASSAAREEAYSALRSEAARFAPIQQGLLEIDGNDPDAVISLLEGAGEGLERYVLALEYATQVETAYRFALAAVEKYRSLKKVAD